MFMLIVLHTPRAPPGIPPRPTPMIRTGMLPTYSSWDTSSIRTSTPGGNLSAYDFMNFSWDFYEYPWEFVPEFLQKINPKTNKDAAVGHQQFSFQYFDQVTEGSEEISVVIPVFFF